MGLQLSLIIIGLIIIAAVFLSSYDKARINKTFLQKKQHRVKVKKVVRSALTKMEKKFRTGMRLDINPGPVLEAEKRTLTADADSTDLDVKQKIDPFYDGLQDFEQAASMPIDSGVGVATDLSEESNSTSSAIDNSAVRSMPDQKTDFIIALPGRKPVMRDKALGVYKQNEYMLEKPHALFGLRYIEGVWTNLDSDPEATKYGDLALTVQLVDGSGSISESELTTFSQVGLKLADALRRPSRHAMSFESALERAHELDEFCQKYDVIASINILPNKPEGFNGRDIEKAATQNDMHFGAMNIFHRKNEEAKGCRHMFSLANLYQPGEFVLEQLDTMAVKGLTLFMHVPCTYEPDAAFSTMAETADYLADTLSGKLYDQEKRELDEKGLSVIRAQIVKIQTGMAAQGVIPGSERALRLFAI